MSEKKATKQISDAIHHKNYAYWVKLAAISSSSLPLLQVIIKFYAWLVSDSSAMLASTTDYTLDLFTSVMIMTF